MQLHLHLPYVSFLNRGLATLWLCSLAYFILPAQENTSILCSDGIDNDGDGDIDCEDADCIDLPNEGCSTCFFSSQSFGDVILSENINCQPDNENADASEVLGVADYNGIPMDGKFVSLGMQGYIEIGFTDNILINSGDSDEDLWIFEIGPAVESMIIELRPFNQETIDRLIGSGFEDVDGDGYFSMGSIGGSTSGLDIDDRVVGFTFSELRFDAVRVIDRDGDCGGRTPGADIDAICALSNIEIDCNGILLGTAIIDSCGVCLDAADPNLNQSCLDCAGTVNGIAVIDNCGLCLDPADPNFNLSCVDCAGTMNGLAMTDDCGLCLDPDDPEFNLSCADCAGIINGLAILDLCGDCLEPSDPLFNQACVKSKNIYTPNIINSSSSADNQFSLQVEVGAITEVLTYAIYDRWGNLVFGFINQPTLYDEMIWWDGFGYNQGVYTFIYEIEYYDGEQTTCVGQFTKISN